MQDETNVHFKGHLYLIFHPFVEMIVLKTCFQVQFLNFIILPNKCPFVFYLMHKIEIHESKMQVDDNKINT